MENKPKDETLELRVQELEKEVNRYK